MLPPVVFTVTSIVLAEGTSVTIQVPLSVLINVSVGEVVTPDIVIASLIV